MPFTPLHLGINGTVGFVFKKKIDLLSCIFANIVIDVQPFLVLILGINIPLHGFSHTLLGGTIIIIPVFCVYGLIINRLFSYKKISSYILGGFIGMIFHILFDAINHSDIQIFAPFSDIVLATDYSQRLVFPIWILGYICFALLLIIKRKTRI